jgi:NAD(P)-dependent dehydrogenase (short-subunit alcohol dehydrogenase family)
VAAGRLEGVRAVVTGGSRGLGRAVVEAFAREGARVVTTARDAGRLESLVRDLRRAPGGPPLGLAMALEDPAGVRDAAARAVAHLGRVDVLVNSAAVFGPRAALIDTPAEDLAAAMAVNMVGLLAVTRAVLPAMSDGAAVVNVTSGAAGRPGAGAYGLTKAAVDAATVMLRGELAPRGIRCVAVSPGPLRTDMRREAHPGEDPATVPHPRTVTAAFIAIAAGADPGPAVDAREWQG